MIILRKSTLENVQKSASLASASPKDDISKYG